MATKAPKKKESKERVASAAPKTAEQSVAPSVVGSLRDGDEKGKSKAKQPIVIWPEWSDQDINQEKWDIMHKAKEKEKGKSPNPLLRWIIAQITSLWKLHFKVDIPEVKSKDAKDGKEKDKDKDKEKEKEKEKDAIIEDSYWKPWGHIWPKEKTKGSAMPIYNPGGSIVSRCSGCYAGGSSACEFGDFTVVHALTGWLPEIIPLRNGQTSEIWKLLKLVLPHWKLDKTPPPEERKEEITLETKKDREKERKSTKSVKGLKADDVERESILTATVTEQQPKDPELVIFASYLHPPNTPMRISVLREMADASEKLRLSGLSHNHPHPVLVTAIRDCLLVAPPPPIEIPRWKLIRQKKKKQPVEPPLTPPEPPKDPQFLEVTSPFVNYNVSLIPVSRARTPVKWAKYRPEKPMGEITEEGNKDEDEKKQEDEKKEGGEKKERTEENKEDGAPPESADIKQETESSIKERDSKDSPLRERLNSKDGGKSKDRIKSAKSDKADKDKLNSPTKSRSGSKLLAADKPERTKSGSLTTPKSGRRMSRMEKPGDIKAFNNKESRRISKMERPSKADLDKEQSHDVIPILETDDMTASLEVPTPGGDTEVKAPGEGNDGETNEEKQDGEKTEESDKSKDEKTKDKKLWMDFDDFCKCFSLNPIEIIVSFTGFSKWLDPPQPILREKDKEKERDKDKDSSSSVGGTSFFLFHPNPFLFLFAFPFPIEPVHDLIHTLFPDLKEIISDEKIAPLVPGSLVAEPYSWKSLVTGHPVLRIRSSGTKCAVMCLPPGVSVHCNVSTTRESCRFMEHAMHVIRSVGNLVGSFSDPLVLTRPELNLGLKDESLETQEKHFKVFMKCLFKALKYNLAEAYTQEMHFAWKAFAFQATLCVRQHISQRPLSAADITRIGSIKHGSSVKLSNDVPESWVDRSANVDEESAATKIQASFRGHFVRKLAMAYIAGTETQQQVSGTLTKAWSTLEPNLENFAVEIFRRMFKKNEKLFPLFPFFKDEWSRVAYTDYTGGYPEQPANSWFFTLLVTLSWHGPVQLEVFMVDESVLMVPKLYINLPTCLLRVVDNDTGEELSRVFERVAPSQMKRNKVTYLH
ncbi:hypothetical protein QZH41_007285 [Actinostola sp. cb2023]|nr:hypothetical protein QZH41_007285 [Actinostola sp. cb2023]